MKTYQVLKSRKGKEDIIEGTLEELIEYFGYTLLCGHQRNSKIPEHPKTFKSLINALNKSVEETQSVPDTFYEVV